MDALSIDSRDKMVGRSFDRGLDLRSAMPKRTVRVSPSCLSEQFNDDADALQRRLLVCEIDASFVPQMEHMLADYDAMTTRLAEENRFLRVEAKRLREENEGRICLDQLESEQGGGDLELPKQPFESEGSDKKHKTDREVALLRVIEVLRKERAEEKQRSQKNADSLKEELMSTRARYAEAKEMLHENARLLVAARDFITSQQQKDQQQRQRRDWKETEQEDDSSSSMYPSTEENEIARLNKCIASLQEENVQKNEAVLKCLHDVMVYLFKSTGAGGSGLGGSGSGAEHLDPSELINSVRLTSRVLASQIMEGKR